ncbi:putative permease [Granulicella aggregans]|uniref:Putative permease n=1 Tax=Granulicella aggregans TaxID=474949 RepID=A0A7W7ZCP6_9BACT|nr:ABC transporter permease [Granulicella aggregans]MBB5057397.1 putative permease [Granulicella aggregans]
MHFDEFVRRVTMLVRGKRFQGDLDEEMRLHRELREEHYAASGMSSQAARSAAHRSFGNAVSIREASYGAWGWNWLESLTQDVRYGARSMFRSPGLTLVALLSLALGIGANTAIFSFIDAVLLRSLPVKDPARLVVLGDGDEMGITDRYGSTTLYSYPFFRQMQQKNAVFSNLAAVYSYSMDIHGTLNGNGEMQAMKVQLVSGSYFQTLGIRTAMGRAITEDDDSSEGDHPVAVISYAWWKRALGGDTNVLGRKIKLGTSTFQIVGVTPPEFFGTRVGEAPEVWIPMSMMESIPPGLNGYKDNFAQSMHIMGRLKPDVTREKATADVNLLYQQITRAFPDVKLIPRNVESLSKTHVVLTPMTRGLSSLRRSFSAPLEVLMAATALVLLIACANIANLLLARSTARAREFAVRQALGARRIRIVRQLLTESLMLALGGGAAGIGLAAVADRLLLHMVSRGSEVLPLDVSINTRLLLFTFAVTVATAVFFGIIPAVRGTQVKLTNALKDGRGSAGGGNSRSTLGKCLIIAQVAISLVLMVGAILFVRTLVNLTKLDTGFNREGVLRLEVDSNVTGLPESDPRMVLMFQEIERRVSALPGVRAASFASFVFAQGSWNTAVNVPGMTMNEKIDVKHNTIGNGYFATMQIPLVAGRIFGPQDTATSHKVAIISERMAKELFPAGVNPIGRHYFTGYDPIPNTDVEVVGIVKDVKFGDLQEDPEYIDYIPNPQRPWGYGSFAVRFDGNFNTLSNAVQQTIHSVNRDLPISGVTTLDEQVSRTMTNQRVVAQLSTFFGLLAVFLSCIGIYGLMSYMVSRRTNEIGIRIAIGATRGNVSWLIMSDIVLLVTIGIAVGIPVSIAGSRLVANMLYGLPGTDVASLLGAVVTLMLVSTMSGYLPAHQAAHLDPTVALRRE